MASRRAEDDIGRIVSAIEEMTRGGHAPTESATGATFLATSTGPTVALADTFTARAERALVARAAGATLMAETVETWAMAILKLVWC